MKKIIAFTFAATSLVFSCKSKTAAAHTNNSTKVATSPKVTASEPLTAEALSKGKALFETSCVKCHMLPNPAKYTDTQWVGIMNAMAPKAKLSGEQSELVYNYVTSKN